jgi:hypothetical protein
MFLFADNPLGAEEETHLRLARSHRRNSQHGQAVRGCRAWVSFHDAQYPAMISISPSICNLPRPE